MNATRVLISQHRAIEALFDELAREPRRHARARALSRLTEELIAHMAGEEAIFYPAARQALGDVRRPGDGVDEHYMLRAQLRRVLVTNVNGPAFRPRFEALRLLFAHHVQAEETELFPRVQAALGPSQLDTLGAEVLDSRPPIWLVTTESHALLRSDNPRAVRGVRLPSVR
jgi:hemerythrin superfamily protein